MRVRAQGTDADLTQRWSTLTAVDGDGQIVRFRIGEAFPAKSQLARWMTVCAMALNDLLVVNSLLLPRLEEKIRSEHGENFYLARSAAGHLFELATFLRKADRVEAVKEFVAELDDPGATTAYADLLRVGEGGTGKFYEQLKHARNKTFHYQELFIGSHEEREPLKRALAGHAKDELDKECRQGEIRDVPPMLTGFRATFAYDVAVEMLLPGETELEYLPFIQETSAHIGKFARFAKAALNAYTETTASEVWDIEHVTRSSDFFELLNKLQALVGQEVSARVLFGHRFFGADFHARLERVETIPTGDAVRAEFSNGVAFDLAPEEQSIGATDDGLELRIGPELVLLLTSANDSDGAALGPS